MKAAFARGRQLYFDGEPMPKRGVEAKLGWLDARRETFESYDRCFGKVESDEKLTKKGENQ